MNKLTWYRPWVIEGDPHTFVAKFVSETGDTKDLKFSGLQSIHNNDEEAIEAIKLLEAVR